MPLVSCRRRPSFRSPHVPGAAVGWPTRPSASSRGRSHGCLPGHASALSRPVGCLLLTTCPPHFPSTPSFVDVLCVYTQLSDETLLSGARLPRSPHRCSTQIRRTRPASAPGFQFPSGRVLGCKEQGCVALVPKARPDARMLEAPSAKRMEPGPLLRAQLAG
ncbi:hypothetical protein TRVL_01299 [Trypanosoma vivax]|nr:hypothetical protein TRVL_01299 [Trypanosoma vivax]